MEQVISVLNPFAIFGDFEFRFAPAFSKRQRFCYIFWSCLEHFFHQYQYFNNDYIKFSSLTLVSS